MEYVAIAIALWVGLVVYREFSKRPGASDRVPNEAASAGLPEKVDIDAREGSFWEVQDPLPVSARLRIEYVDAAGVRTERNIDVRQFGKFGEGVLIVGHCHLRRASRTFRADRIRKCIDLDTGEVIPSVVADLQHRYDVSPDRQLGRLLADEYDTLRVMLYVGKADGQLRAAERAIIRETCLRLAPDSNLSDEAIKELFAYMSVPTIHAFKLAVGRLVGKGSQAQSIVLTACERMVATQKDVHQAEKDALDYMRRKFLAD